MADDPSNNEDEINVHSDPITTKDPRLNPTSPYYLHPDETLGYVLVSPPLSGGDNYYHWSRAIKCELAAKNKIGFINGTLPQPPQTDPLYDAWQRCNNMVVSCITRSLSPQISESTAPFYTARDLWLDLEHRFTHFRMSDLLQELHSIKQGERSLSTFFTDLQILWDELESLRPTPSCSCTIPCSCDLSKSVKSFKDKENVLCFLKGLNEPFQPVRSQILLMNPLPTISQVYSMVLRQERNTSHSPLTESTAFAYNSTSFPSQGRGNPNQGRGRGRFNAGQPMVYRTEHQVESSADIYLDLDGTEGRTEAILDSTKEDALSQLGFKEIIEDQLELDLESLEERLEKEILSDQEASRKNKKIRVCNHWAYNMNCKFGRFCFDAHDSEELQLPKPHQPTRYYVCPFFRSKVGCRHGNNCRLSHV